MDINTTLLREKFIIRDLEEEGEVPLTVQSNRLVLPLRVNKGDFTETIVVRAQNMHCCNRMGAQIVHAYASNGSIVNRVQKFDFESAWDKSCSRYEKITNLLRWVAVYHNGKEIFAAGNHHGFFDVIEKCDEKNPGNYDQAIKIAEDTFAKMGRKTSISYDANIAMVLNTTSDMARCGLIDRSAGRNSTFNFVAENNPDDPLSPSSCLHVSAAFLEGLQLSYKIGAIQDRIHLMVIEKYSSEARHATIASDRLNELDTEIKGFENRFKTKFRPERPNFGVAIKEAERAHKKAHDTQTQR